MAGENPQDQIQRSTPWSYSLLETRPGVTGMSEADFSVRFDLGGTTALFVPAESIGFLQGLFLFAQKL